MSIIKRGIFLKRMVYAYSAVFAVILLLFMFIFYQYIKSTSLRMADLNQRELANQTVKQLDSFLGEMENAGSRVMNDQQLLSIYSRLQQDTDPANYFSANVLEDIDARSILTNINGVRMPFWRISVYNQYGDFISTGALTDAQQVIQNLYSADVKADINEIFAASASVLYPPAHDGWSDYYTSEYITLKMPVMNIYSKEVYAVAEIQQDIRSLRERLAYTGQSDLQISVTDADGNTVINAPADTRKLHTVSATSESFGWTVTLSKPQSALLRPYLPLIALFFGGCILLFFIIVYAVILIARRVSLPLVRLKDAVSRITISSAPEVYRTNETLDEVAQLDSAFEAMLYKLNRTVEQEKKITFLAMQSQMNPHFLYNTLSVISASALETGNQKIVDMCDSLSAMMRYTASYNSVVTMKDEIGHLENYLKLMHERYEGDFIYDISYDDRILTALIPKLVLQPLAENSFKHGFSGTEPPYRLSVYIGVEDGYKIIRVTDNGAGFPDEVKSTLLQTIEDFKNNVTQGYEKLETGGLGLRNSILRLMLYNHAEISCTIENLQPHGTVITIKGGLL